MNKIKKSFQMPIDKYDRKRLEAESKKTLSLSLSLYIYIYIYMRVCVCVCVYDILPSSYSGVGNNSARKNKLFKLQIFKYSWLRAQCKWIHGANNIIKKRKTIFGHIRIINLFPSCLGHWYESKTPKEF